MHQQSRGTTEKEKKKRNLGQVVKSESLRDKRATHTRARKKKNMMQRRREKK